MIKKIKNKIICFILLFIIILPTHYYASEIIRKNNTYNGPGITPFDIVEVAGDSYAENFSEYLHDTYGKNYSNYAIHGTTIIENKQSILNCIKDKYKCIIISIGVNDHSKQTDLNIFKNTILEFVYTAKEYNKHLILHTYMKYPLNVKYNKKFTCKQYDYILQDVAQINSNVDYINTKSLNTKKYQKDDGIHYNDNFYQELFDKISPIVIKIFNNYEN